MKVLHVAPNYLIPESPIFWNFGSYVTKNLDVEELVTFCDKVLRSEPFDGREKFLAKGYSMATVAEKLKFIMRK